MENHRQKADTNENSPRERLWNLLIGALLCLFVLYHANTALAASYVEAVRLVTVPATEKERRANGEAPRRERNAKGKPVVFRTVQTALPSLNGKETSPQEAVASESTWLDEILRRMGQSRWVWLVASLLAFFCVHYFSAARQGRADSALK